MRYATNKALEDAVSKLTKELEELKSKILILELNKSKVATSKPKYKE